MEAWDVATSGQGQARGILLGKNYPQRRITYVYGEKAIDTI